MFCPFWFWFGSCNASHPPNYRISRQFRPLSWILASNSDFGSKLRSCNVCRRARLTLRRVERIRWYDDFPSDAVRAVFMFGRMGDNRIPDVLSSSWNEPVRRSDGKIGPKISSCIAGESEDSIQERLGRKSLQLMAQRQDQWMIICAYDHFEADAVTFATRCLVIGCSLCVLTSAIPQRTFSSGM